MSHKKAEIVHSSEIADDPAYFSGYWQRLPDDFSPTVPSGDPQPDASEIPDNPTMNATTEQLSRKQKPQAEASETPDYRKMALTCERAARIYAPDSTVAIHLVTTANVLTGIANLLSLPPVKPEKK